MYMLRSVLTAALIVSAYLLPLSHAHSRERNPITYLSKIENAIFKTPSNRVHALSTFDLTFNLHEGQQNMRLTLSPNHDVIAPGATVQYMDADGNLHKAEPLDRLNYRVFKGDTWIKHRPGAEWTNVGWARIMVKQDGSNPIFEGAFRVDGNHHHIQTAANYMQTKHVLDPLVEDEGRDYMIVWRDSDISGNIDVDDEGYMHTDLKRALGDDVSCSADRLEFNTMDPLQYQALVKPDTEFWKLGSISTRRIFGRQIDGQTIGNSAGVNLRNTIGNSAGCFNTKKVALVGVATDCTYTSSFSDRANASIKEATSANVIQVINSASTQFENSFNITLGLQNLVVNEAACPATPPSSAPWNVGCSRDMTLQNRLNLFSQWRGQQSDSNAYWTLMSNCADGSEVGLAWLGQACVTVPQIITTSRGNETVSGANVVIRTGTEWQVVAHETGHMFGAMHDCTETTCADGNTVQSQQCCPFSMSTCSGGGRFIMHPSTGPTVQNFSPCSVGNVCSAIGRNSVNTRCLVSNKDVTLISGSQCGNGIVESGEQCDCGGVDGCGENSCCDAETCQFTQNSVCDPGNEACCTASCQFASGGTVCRASTGVCDPEETCSGTVAACPEDTTAPDGTSCGDKANSLSCASGQCTSRDLQCKTIMGSYTQGNDTYACSSSGCHISCAAPQFGSNVCYSMQQNFLDGTACQGGGKCSNGQCKGSSLGKEIKSWIDNNKTLVIALSTVLGSLILLIITSCIWSVWRRHQPRSLKINERRPMQGRWPLPNHTPLGSSHGPHGWGPSNMPPMRQEPGGWQPAVRYA